MHTNSQPLINFFFTVYIGLTLLILLYNFVTIFFDGFGKSKGNFIYYRNEISKFLISFGIIKLVFDIVILLLQVILIFSVHSYNEYANIDDQDVIGFLLFEIFFGISPIVIGFILKIINNQIVIFSINLQIGENISVTKDGIVKEFKIVKIDSVTTNVHLVDYYSNEDLIVLPYYIVIQQIKLGIFNYWMLGTNTRNLLN